LTRLPVASRNWTRLVSSAIRCNAIRLVRTAAVRPLLIVVASAILWDWDSGESSNFSLWNWLEFAILLA
jgi:hypothetical protein